MLEAAEFVCSGDGIEVAEVLDVLSRLIDKSLVVADKHDDEITLSPFGNHSAVWTRETRGGG